MMTKISAILFGAVFFCLSSTAISAATITVNTLVDENNTNAAACSLREAINNANNDNATNGLGCGAGAGTDVINITVNGTITPTAVLPPISTSMSITGNGAGSLTVSGNNALRVFVINGGTVSINNLTVANGFDSSQAGGIYNTGGGILTLSGVTVTASSSPQGGGFQNDATMTITNSIIRNNATTTDGSGGGAANFGNLTVNGSTFLQNSTPGTSGLRFGGGIRHSGGTLTITNSTFDGNNSNVGGGLYLQANADLTNVTFINNVAGFGGGFESRAIVNCTNCTVSGNTAQIGGGINAQDIGATNNLTLLNSTVSFNKSDSTGGLRVAGTNPIVSLKNTIIAGNTNVAGTTQSDFGGSNVDTANSSFNLIGTGGAGGLVNGVNNNQVGIANTGVLPVADYGGSVQTAPIRTNSPARNAGTNTGAPTTDARGFSRAQGSSIDIGAFEIQTNSIVTNINNTGAASLRNVVAAVPANEIVQFETPLFFSSPQTISLSTGQITPARNITIYGNGANLLTVRNTAAAGSTSRVFIIPGVFTVNLSGMTISGGNLNGDLDELTGSGGGIYSDGGNLTLNAVHITANNGSYRGGGIAAYNGSTTILNSSITNNTMNTTQLGSSGAGGIYTDQQTVVITNSTISGNSAAGETFLTGGMLNVGALNNTTITNCTITNNSALTNGSGGGLVSGNGTTLVRNSIIAANANNSSIPDVRGAITSSGFNIVGNRGSVTGFNQPTDQFGTGGVALDPRLSPLGNYGGTTPIHIFAGTSPAIDKGNSFGSTTDQIGSPRPFNVATIANAPGGDGSDIGAFESQMNPTAAAVSISGQVFTPEGRGLRNAVVTLTDRQGNTLTALTFAFGYYRFQELAAGETYVITVRSKRYQFAPQLVSLNEDLTGLNFQATALSNNVNFPNRSMLK